MTDEHRMPPSDLDAERALLGACMLLPAALDDAIETVRPDDFYRPGHGEIFAAMIGMRDNGHEVDPVTVAAHLGDRIGKVGGHPYLIDLYSSPPTAANAGYYADIVTGHAVRRRLIAAGQRAMQLGYTADASPADTVERARQALDLVAASARGDVRAVEIDELGAAALTRYASPEPPALSTGWPDLDRIMSGGFRPGTVTVIGARPAVGKTLVGANIAAAAALAGHGGLFVSLEMTKDELTDRIISNLASVDLEKLTRHQLSQHDWRAVEDATDKLRGMPLAVIDEPYLSITGIRAHARDRTRTARGLSLLVVDYLGLVRPADAKRDRREQVDAISRGLKLLAKELHIPVVALHQLNRQSEMRANKRPALSDLRESGAVEQDADTVWLLHRDPDEEERRFELEVIVAKNRQGRTGSVSLQWAPHYARAGSYTRLEAV